jgi:hypothetical protein
VPAFDPHKLNRAAIRARLRALDQERREAARAARGQDRAR